MLVQELDLIDPLEAVECLSELPNLTFLDSAMRHPSLGRYSYVATDPFGSFVVQGGKASWNGRRLDGDPLAALKKLMTAQAHKPVLGLPPFQGGAAGFFAYDFGRVLERLSAPSIDEQNCPQAILHFYDTVLAFDHLLGRCWLLSSEVGPGDVMPCRGRGSARRERILALLKRRRLGPGGALSCSPIARGEWTSNFTSGSYAAAVRRVVEHILAGDIFQANIAQRFTAELPPSFNSWAFYRRLRTLNPAPFAAYLQYGDMTIASSSPERFLMTTEQGEVEARPIKGTAARAKDSIEDRRQADALLASEKDRAENLMIVDLLRNDLSRVCRPHSVHAPVLCGLESYASVHHLVSVVTGVLENGVNAIDLIRACFPGGSVTGAPKLRAMDVITETERHARGIYCGSILNLGFNGCADSNIAIRSISIAGGKAVFQVGGGITALSDPAAEYEETLAKAERIFQAFDIAPLPGVA